MALIKPDLAISPHSKTFALLRRSQVRSDSLFPSQTFPQKTSRLAPWLMDNAISHHDQYWLDQRQPERRRDLFAWASTERGNSLFLSPEFESEITRGARHDTSLDAGLGGIGLTLYGQLASRLTFFAHGLVYTEVTDRKQFSHQFNPDLGETYSVEKGAGDSLLENRSFNRHTFYTSLNLSWITFKAGRDHIHTGPGYFSSLMLGRETPPYYLVQAIVDFAPWLQLDNYLLRMTDTDHSIRKYANLHRFEFHPVSTLSLAFQDIVIYQDRDIDARYLIPLAPLTFTESNNGGLDNAAMSCDFHWLIKPNFSVWGELFIDDLLGPSAFFDDFWENRWAVLFGFQATSPLSFFDADFIFEYSQVEPWTYIGRKPQTSFKHFNVPSASKLGPDSRSLDLQLAYRPFIWVELTEHWESNDKGLGRQATLGVVHDDVIDPIKKSLLGNRVEIQRILTQSVAFLFGPHIMTHFTWSHDFGDIETDVVRASLALTW